MDKSPIWMPYEEYLKGQFFNRILEHKLFVSVFYGAYLTPQEIFETAKKYWDELPPEERVIIGEAFLQNFNPDHNNGDT